MTIQTYGHDGTIHDSEYVDVEVDSGGKVVAVWFRCMALPFKQSVADDFRADMMRDHPINIRLKAVQYDDGLVPEMETVAEIDMIDSWAGRSPRQDSAGGRNVRPLGFFWTGVRKWSEWWCGVFGA